MESDPHAAPNTAPGTTHPPAPPARQSGLSWTIVVPLLCLAATAGIWYQTHRELTSMRADQQELRATVDAGRSAPVIDVAGAPATGSPDAVVTLIEFADYECPFCIRHFTQTMPQIDAAYVQTGKLRYVFKDFPIDSLHPASIHAHEAAACAAEQHRFWEMHQRLFSAPGTHTAAALEARAAEAGLQMDAFRACMASGRTTAGIRQSVASVVQLGASGTPVFFVGIRDPATDQVRVLRALAGAQPYAEFQKMIADVTAQARKGEA
jgi:protein-disulfide isomerase